ncbi:MAG TPA: AI-2E family transporter [Gammaproteobacteria bacterium]
MNPTTVQKAFFFALLVGITGAFLWLVRGFLQPVFWAVALGIVVFPVHARIERWMRGRSSLAALTSVLLVVVIVILPLIGIATAVTAEATALFARIDTGDLGVNEIYRGLQQRLPLVASLLERAGLDPERLESQLAAGAVQLSRLIASRALAIGQDTLRITVFFFLMLYLLFFFLRDGPGLLEGLVRALPLGDARERHLLQRFAEVSRATIKGTLVVGIVQGTIGGVTFAFLGIGGALLWGVVMTILSILPAIGPGLVWVPATIYLFVNGQILSAVILLAVGVLGIGLVDNVLRPILVGRDTRMPDYLILLATLGGLAAFGLAGIIIGPIIAAFFLSVWHMAQEEFVGDEDEEAPSPASAAAAAASNDLELPAPAAEQHDGDDGHGGLGDRHRPEDAARPEP